MMSIFATITLLLGAAGANCLLNPGFQRGLEGWRAEGNVTVQNDSKAPGKHYLLLGNGFCSVRQTYKVPGLRILWFGVALQPSAKEANTRVRLQCLDHAGRELLNLSASPGKDTYASIYLKTQAFTDSIVVSIEKDGPGSVTAHDPILTDDDKNRVEHPPELDLHRAMEPIWSGSSVYEESVLLLSEKGQPGKGRLIFRPSKILSVKDPSLKKTYEEGRDFVVKGNVISAVLGASIPTMSREEFPKGNLPWPRFDGRHVFVSYLHDDFWNGPVPKSQSDILPETTKLLRTRKPLTIIAYGDSITLGVNVSGFRNVPPYLPPWPTLAANRLREAYRDPHIALYNTSLGGMTSEWAKDNANDIVASLKPDLVVIAFGMNDFWSISPADFKANIKATMARIMDVRPRCEFVLVTAMRFDANYTHDQTYVSNFNAYAEVLRGLAGKGVALMDMTKMSDALCTAASHYDLATDPMHPDDFLARWYAQSLVRTLGK